MPPDQSGELKAMDLATLLIVYGNWRGRFLPQRPRRVHFSRELNADQPQSIHRAALDRISADIEAGAELAPYLSTRIETAYVPHADRRDCLPILTQPLHTTGCTTSI